MIDVDIHRTGDGAAVSLTAHGVQMDRNQRVGRIEIFGDGKPGPIGSYHYTMSVNRGAEPEIIASGRIARFARDRGYWPLVREILNAVATEHGATEEAQVEHCNEG